MIQQITFDQLVKGVFTDAARKRFVEVIAQLGAGWLRRRGPGVHRVPAAHLAGSLAAAYAGLDRSARPRRCEHRRRRPAAGLAGRLPDGLSGPPEGHHAGLVGANVA